MNSKTLAAGIISLIIFFIRIWDLEGKPTNQKNDTDDSNIRLCGKDLTEMLKATCNSFYNYPDVGETREIGPEARGSRVKRGIKKRGLYHECCYQSCSLRDLLSYCYDNSSSANKEISQNLSIPQRGKKSMSRGTFEFKDNDIHVSEKNNNLTPDTKEKRPPKSAIINKISENKINLQNVLRKSSTSNIRAQPLYTNNSNNSYVLIRDLLPERHTKYVHISPQSHNVLF